MHVICEVWLHLGVGISIHFIKHGILKLGLALGSFHVHLRPDLYVYGGGIAFSSLIIEVGDIFSF